MNIRGAFVVILTIAIVPAGAGCAKSGTHAGEANEASARCASAWRALDKVPTGDRDEPYLDAAGNRTVAQCTQAQWMVAAVRGYPGWMDDRTATANAARFLREICQRNSTAVACHRPLPAIPGPPYSTTPAPPTSSFRP